MQFIFTIANQNNRDSKHIKTGRTLKGAPIEQFHPCFDHFHLVLGVPLHVGKKTWLGVLIKPKLFLKKVEKSPKLLKKNTKIGMKQAV